LWLQLQFDYVKGRPSNLYFWRNKIKSSQTFHTSYLDGLNKWTRYAGDAALPAQLVLLINAAGAWCDEVATLAGVAPVGLVPKRRTAFTSEAPADCDISDWPLVIDAQESFYFKPDAGVLLISPANEDPVRPQDVQPEELDVAIAVDRVETATTLRIRQVRHKWAGLRSFVADKSPVVGFAADAPGFFWLAGQGGYGIQTAPAMGELCAALVQGLPVPVAMAARGARVEALCAQRSGLGDRSG
jgi:D-arginine dehydrogenase